MSADSDLSRVQGDGILWWVMQDSSDTGWSFCILVEIRLWQVETQCEETQKTASKGNDFIEIRLAGTLNIRMFFGPIVQIVGGFDALQCSRV